MLGVSNPSGAGSFASTVINPVAINSPIPPLNSSEESALDEELRQDIAVSRTQSFAQSNFPRPLGHRHQHDVDDADRAQRQGHESDDPEEIIHGVEDLAHALRVFNGVPVFEGIFQLGIEAMAARDDLVNLLFRPQVLGFVQRPVVDE